jgi:hypothetical protein
MEMAGDVVTATKPTSDELRADMMEMAGGGRRWRPALYLFTISPLWRPPAPPWLLASGCMACWCMARLNFTAGDQWWGSDTMSWIGSVPLFLLNPILYIHFSPNFRHNQRLSGESKL